MRPLLGTYVEVGILGAEDTSAAFRCAYAAMENVQQRLSFHDPHSELSRLNLTVGEFIQVSPLTARVLRLGRALGIASCGLFNYTVGGALVRRGLLPDHGGPQPLESGTAADVQVRGCEVRLMKPLRVTLDGIAKGYAVDSAINALQRLGVRGAWVNAGGDLRAIGSVTLPVSRREIDGSVKPLGGLRDSALATSAVRASMDPRFPGLVIAPDRNPASPGSWTVLAHRAWRADALTKVAALAPVTLRSNLVSRLGGRLIEPAQVVHR